MQMFTWMINYVQNKWFHCPHGCIGDGIFMPFDYVNLQYAFPLDLHSRGRIDTREQAAIIISCMKTSGSTTFSGCCSVPSFVFTPRALCLRGYTRKGEPCSQPVSHQYVWGVSAVKSQVTARQSIFSVWFKVAHARWKNIIPIENQDLCRDSGKVYHCRDF